jgi:hypothetical protein
MLVKVSWLEKKLISKKDEKLLKIIKENSNEIMRNSIKSTIYL